jgi:hypothetical protein
MVCMLPERSSVSSYLEMFRSTDVDCNGTPYDPVGAGVLLADTVIALIP